MRRYSELSKLKTFEERYEYLKLGGTVGESTFGFDRYFNQAFYHSPEWKKIRQLVILRDSDGNSVLDLGVEDHPISGRIYIHHMNPISLSDIENKTDFLLNPDFLICVSKDTHDAIHYGADHVFTRNEIIERKPFDTCLWRT